MELDHEIINDILYIDKNLEQWTNELDYEKFTKPQNNLSLETCIKLKHQWNLEYELFNIEYMLNRLLEWYCFNTVHETNEYDDSFFYYKEAKFGKFYIRYLYVSATKFDNVLDTNELTMSYKTQKYGEILVIRPYQDEITFIPGAWINEFKQELLKMIEDKKQKEKDKIYITNDIILPKKDLDKYKIENNFIEDYHNLLNSNIILNRTI